MPATEPHDLRAFFHRVGHFSGERALSSSPVDRPVAGFDVELLDPADSRPVTGPALEPYGFADGIQASLLVTYRAHRPVYLHYVAAGCLSPDGRLVRSIESMFVCGSSLDADWYSGLDAGIPWVELPETRPDELPAAGLRLLAGRRDAAERGLLDGLVAAGDVPVVVDGHLASRPVDTGMVGLVKTSRTRYLPDESLLWGMPAGHVSPRFRIPEGTMGVAADRYSCYLRLHDAARQAWDFGLVRLEAYDPELLMPLAALAMRERQSARSRDARFDRHLAGVRGVEDALRALRPSVFSL